LGTIIPSSFSTAINLPYLHTQEMEIVLRFTASLHAAMQPIIHASDFSCFYPPYHLHFPIPAMFSCFPKQFLL